MKAIPMLAVLLTAASALAAAPHVSDGVWSTSTG
jgi:hypothetical protein